jgi:hypothetical protein
VHDPVTPRIVQPAVIGWEAKNRQIDLVIERAFKGEELLRRMKGWITIDPNEVIDTIRTYGKLKVLNDCELIVETETVDQFSEIQKALLKAFGDQVDIELIDK